MTCRNNQCEYTPTLKRTPLAKAINKPAYVIVCNYSTTQACNGKCEKCQFLPQIQIVNITKEREQ